MVSVTPSAWDQGKDLGAPGRRLSVQDQSLFEQPSADLISIRLQGLLLCIALHPFPTLNKSQLQPFLCPFWGGRREQSIRVAPPPTVQAAIHFGASGAVSALQCVSTRTTTNTRVIPEGPDKWCRLVWACGVVFDNARLRVLDQGAVSQAKLCFRSPENSDPSPAIPGQPSAHSGGQVDPY